MSAPTDPNLTSIPDDHPMGRFVAPLIAAKKGIQTRMHGTAFIIAPELALTAQHVVVDYLESIQGDPISERLGRVRRHDGQMTFHMFMLLTLREGRQVPLTVAKMYGSHPGDITLLRLSKPAGFEWTELAPFPVLRLVPPNKGEAVAALGYPNSSVNHRPDGVVELHTWPRITSGTVQQVHAMRRDSCVLNYPCLQVDASFEGGMSGGPVLDEAERVCGVVSTSYDLLDQGDPIAYSASLWPACRIAIPYIPRIPNDDCRLFDLMKRGRVATLDIEKVTAGFTPDGRIHVSISDPTYKGDP